MSDLLTPKQVADLLNINHRTLEGWRAKRIGPPWVKLGPSIRSRIRYSREAVEKFMSQDAKS